MEGFDCWIDLFVFCKYGREDNSSQIFNCFPLGKYSIRCNKEEVFCLDILNTNSICYLVEVQNIIADVDCILKAPETQDEGVWKYEHLRQFCMELNGLAVKLQVHEGFLT